MTAVADTAELLVALVRSGLTPALAVRAAATHAVPDSAEALNAVVARLDHGDRLADAITSLVVHHGPDARPLADAIALCERYGLPLAPILDQLATEARSARRRAAERSARELPVRLTLPLVLCTLPSFVLLAIVPVLIGALSSLSTTP